MRCATQHHRLGSVFITYSFHFQHFSQCYTYSFIILGFFYWLCVPTEPPVLPQLKHIWNKCVQKVSHTLCFKDENFFFLKKSNNNHKQTIASISGVFGCLTPVTSFTYLRWPLPPWHCFLVTAHRWKDAFVYFSICTYVYFLSYPAYLQGWIVFCCFSFLKKLKVIAERRESTSCLFCRRWVWKLPTSSLQLVAAAAGPSTGLSAASRSGQVCSVQQAGGGHVQEAPPAPSEPLDECFLLLFFF